MKKLKLGVLGLGEGRSILAAATASDLWDVACICDLDENLCRTRAAEFKLTKWTLNYDAMLSDASIDVIAIYTPDPLHATHIAAALSSGKHVICTKPLIDNLADAPALLELAARANRRVFVGQSSRFFAPMIRQRADFEAGKNGELFSVEAHYHADNRWFSKKAWAKSGGLKWLYGGLSHPVDLVRWYLPDIEEVFGYGLLTDNGRKLGLTHPDAMHFVLKSASGKIARVSGCYSSPPGHHGRDSHMTAIVRGSTGTSQADYYDLRYSTHFSGEGCRQYDMEDLGSYYFRFGGRSHHAGEYQNYIEHFARAIAANDTPRPDLAEGIVTVAVMHAMEKSLATGLPQRVRDVLEEQGLSAVAR